jgi:hypothetical protein
MFDQFRFECLIKRPPCFVRLLNYRQTLGPHLPLKWQYTLLSPSGYGCKI